MKVLHVIPSLDSRQGGPPSALSGLAPAQAQAGLDVTIAFPWRRDADRSLEDLFQRAGITLAGFGPASGPLLRHPEMAERIGSLVRDADVVHIHALWEEIQHRAAAECQRHSKPYLVTPHGMLTPWSLRQRWLKKQIYLAWRLRRNLRRAAAIHCSSGMEARAVAALALGPRILTEPFGLDLEEFRKLPERGLFRREYGVPPDRLLIVFLGRVHPGKGVEVLLPAVARLQRKDVTVAIVGPDSGGYLAQMQALAQTEGIADRVIFTGMRRGIQKLSALVDADLFALPSEHENFGMAVIEALAAGCPVVISDQVGVGEDIRDAGVAGVAGLSVDATAGTLKQWLDDAELRRAASIRARALVQERYDQRVIGRRWGDYYDQIARARAMARQR